MKQKVEKMFNDCKEKYGSVVWNDGFFDYELALTEKPYSFGPFENWFLSASAMDKGGNLWDVIWDPVPDADKWDDISQVADWDRPSFAVMVEIGYYLDD